MVSMGRLEGEESQRCAGCFSACLRFSLVIKVDFFLFIENIYNNIKNVN